MADHMAAMEERLARLEETVFFQERLIGELNEALAEQQQAINELTHRADTLRDEVWGLREQLDAGSAPVNSPPPHYL